MAINGQESTVPEIVPKNGKLGEGEEAERWPPWLKPLLKANFFGQCKLHDDPRKNVCNMYCLDCMNDSLCSSCLGHHKDKCTIIQIRRSCCNNVVRVSDIPEYMDISSIKEYTVNRAQVVFLKKRPPTRAGKGIGVTHACLVCNHGFVTASRFCSLYCMVFWESNVQKNNQTQLGNEVREDAEPSNRNSNKGSNRLAARRRKVIPHRAATKWEIGDNVKK